VTVRRPRDEQEVRELVALAERTLGSSCDRFVETGVVPAHIDCGGGTYGPLRDAAHHEHTRGGVRVYRPSAVELETAQAWHDHCAVHGYPTGERAGMTDGYPPSPVHDYEGEWIEISWQRVRSILVREATRLTRDEQLCLEVAA
jgi:hypothetical protein